ncbi:GNAT family N-acetyltransferase [Moritella marina ATCC 15381]|uniref:GNAT family N-acetyltransferase n=1 Tax=Moritella marina ATCC 15381 TaxID=1202962 RepID=A0A5J6WK51_MORMI|nr:GNAT family N-acetyltransferase [Moritella marina]QFI37804.1 GNAT family N-acetyltransferase [Moritella marina ATCC 15381]
MNIVEAELSDLALFFDYLDKQLKQNGSDEFDLFQPIASKDCQVSDQLRHKFKAGFDVEFGNATWRKLWLAKDQDGHICGHIDLRHPGSEHSYHRVLLGMGVDIDYRKKGIGLRLVNTVVDYCVANSSIDWLDLNVLACNLAAKNLYVKSDFQIIGECPDYYRIDGKSIAEISMAKNVSTLRV